MSVWSFALVQIDDNSNLNAILEGGYKVIDRYTLFRYKSDMAILDFSDDDTEKFFRTGSVSKRCRWTSAKKVAARKLDMLEYAQVLHDLKVPPNNRLEKLRGNLNGYYSIRVNDQWRVVFKWSVRGASEVKIMDYHRG